MQSPNQVFITVLSVILFGYVLKRLKYITEADGRIVSKFLMHTTFPALVFVATYRTKLDWSLFLIPVVYAISGLILIALGWKYFEGYDRKTKGLLMMAFGATNVGMFGFPMVEGLFGKEALRYMIMYDLGNTFLGFGVIYPMAKYLSTDSGTGVTAGQVFKKVIQLPPLIGMLLGLACNILSVYIPEFIMRPAEILAQGNKPIGLLLLGFFMSFQLRKDQVINITKALTIKYLYCIILALIVYYFMPVGDAKTVLMICLFLPLGLTILPFSVEMDFDVKLAGTMVNISLVISFILIWVLSLSVF